MDTLEALRVVERAPKILCVKIYIMGAALISRFRGKALLKG